MYRMLSKVVTLEMFACKSCCRSCRLSGSTLCSLAPFFFQEEVLYHRKEHRAIVRAAIESALQRYLWNPGMCGGGCGITSESGGMMALGKNCFLFRPGKQRNPSPLSTARYDSSGGSVSKRRDSSIHEDNNPSRSSSETSSGQQEMDSRGNGLDPTWHKRGVGGVSGDVDEVAGVGNVGHIASTTEAVTVFTGEAELRELRVSASAADNTASASYDAMSDKSGCEERASKPEQGGVVFVCAEGATNGVSGDMPEIKDREVPVSGSNMDSTASGDNNDPTEKRLWEEGEGATSDTNVWREDVHVGLSGKERTRLDVADGTSDGATSLNGTQPSDESNVREQGGEDEHTDAEAHDPQLGAQSFRYESNTGLRQLLRDMTAAAKAVTLNCAKKDERGAGPIDAGTTAVILLDAPLLSPKTVSAFSTGRGRSLHTAGDTPQTDALRDDNVDDFDENTAAKDETSVQRRNSVDVDIIGNNENQQEDGDDGFAAVHPAGLGDPNEALEALMLWIREGTSMGPGHREIVLVCGSHRAGVDPSMEVDSLKHVMCIDAHGGSVTDDEEVSGVAVGQDGGTNTAGSNSDIDDGHDNGIHAADVNVVLADVSGNGLHEGEVSGHCNVSANDDREKLTQVVLGGMMTASPEARQENVPGKGSTATPRAQEKVQADGDKPTVIETNQGQRSSQSEVPLQVCNYIAQQTRQQLSSRPSEMLLKTRSLSGGNENRLTLLFPPNIVVAATPRNISCSTVERVETWECSRSSNDGPRVVVGPVIGRVGPTSAVILVEVDAMRSSMAASATEGTTTAGDVGVQLTDTLSGRRHAMIGGFWTGEQPGTGPRVFEVEGLTPGRRYSVRLTGVRQRDQVNEPDALYVDSIAENLQRGGEGNTPLAVFCSIIPDRLQVPCSPVCMY